MRRLAVGGILLALTLCIAQASEAQVVCAKTNARGATRFKIRSACRTGEVPADSQVFRQVPEVPRVRVFASHSYQRVVVGTGGVAVPVDGSATTLDVPTTADSSDLVVMFHAECANFSSAPWLDVDVKVDGAALGSTAQSHVVGDDAFCSDELWATNSVTVVAKDVGPGVHEVGVDAYLLGLAGSATGSGTIDDAGLTVIAVPN